MHDFMEPVGLPTHWSATLHGPHLWYERSISMHSLCFNTLQSARPGDCMEATVCCTCSIDLLLLLETSVALMMYNLGYASPAYKAICSIHYCLWFNG